MKRLAVVAAGTLALMSGAAFAGDGGCSYGKMAGHEAQTPVLAAVDEAEAERLEKLKLIEQQAALEAEIQVPVVFN